MSIAMLQLLCIYPHRVAELITRTTLYIVAFISFRSWLYWSLFVSESHYVPNCHI